MVLAFMENSTRLLLIEYFNHLLCSTFGPTVPLLKRQLKALKFIKEENCDIVLGGWGWFCKEAWKVRVRGFPWPKA